MVWFSLIVVALSEDNKTLLCLICGQWPKLLTMLAHLTGRQASNLSHLLWMIKGLQLGQAQA